jgi:homoserine kinase
VSVYATAFCPPSIGNVAVGFDVLGQAFDGPGDRAKVTLTREGRVRITAIRGVITTLPTDPEQNTAGRALSSMLQHVPEGLGFDLELDKGIALGSGMGGSAASAVAALVAANALLERPLPVSTLYELAMDGEAAASGSRHGDNVGPMLLGGLVIAPTHGGPVRVPVPKWLHVCVVHPHFVLETRLARAALKGAYELHDFVAQSEGLALVLAGCYSADVALLRRGLRDVLVEPRRAALIPGFAQVKQAALEGGALGASISGAGPSVFGWFESRAQAQVAGAAMVAAFKAAGLAADAYVSLADAPAARVESCVV